MTPFEDLLPEPSIPQLFTQLRAILVYAAEGGALGREHAVIYLDLRSRLLESEVGKLLPGFLYQCVTVFRFKEFIHLYDPDTALRTAFIDRMIERCTTMHESDGAVDLTSTPDGHRSWKF